MSVHCCISKPCPICSSAPGVSFAGALRTLSPSDDVSVAHGANCVVLTDGAAYFILTPDKARALAVRLIEQAAAAENVSEDG